MSKQTQNTIEEVVKRIKRVRDPLWGHRSVMKVKRQSPEEFYAEDIIEYIERHYTPNIEVQKKCEEISSKHRKDLLMLVKLHCEGDDEGFRQMCRTHAMALDAEGKTELAQYIMAQLGETSTFTSETITIEKTDLEKCEEYLDGFGEWLQGRIFSVPRGNRTKGIIDMYKTQKREEVRR
jgi:hypothetical protein